VTSGSSVGVQWYERRLSGGSPTIFQQGTYAPDGFNNPPDPTWFLLDDVSVG
jgi:hypothetical protein